MIIKRLFLLFLVLLTIGFIVYNGFGLVKAQDRVISSGLLSSDTKERIMNECKETDPEQCALYGMKLTSELLRFKEKNNIRKGMANCVGYAQLCSEICNFAMRQNGLRNRTKPVVGYVTFYGINLCTILQAIVPKEYKNFVKDHDFVELNLENKVMYFDASLYDYCIDCTTYKSLK